MVKMKQYTNINLFMVNSSGKKLRPHPDIWTL